MRPRYRHDARRCSAPSATLLWTRVPPLRRVRPRPHRQVAPSPCLAPMVPVLAVMHARSPAHRGAESVSVRHVRLVLWFVCGFILLATCNSFGAASDAVLRADWLPLRIAIRVGNRFSGIGVFAGGQDSVDGGHGGHRAGSHPASTHFGRRTGHHGGIGLHPPWES